MFVGSGKLHTGLKYEKNESENKYQSKDDQDCVLGSVLLSFTAIGDSSVEENYVICV